MQPQFQPGDTVKFDAGEYGTALFEVDAVESAEKHMEVDEDAAVEQVYVVTVLQSSHEQLEQGTADVIPANNTNLTLVK